MSSRTLLEPGVFGVFRPVLLLPEGIAERLVAGQLRAVEQLGLKLESAKRPVSAFVIERAEKPFEN